MTHIPVLLKETIEYLNPQPGDFVIDGTFGSGGHATEILRKISPGGTLLGIDWDKNNITKHKSQIPSHKNVILVHGNYANLPEILEKVRKADHSIPFDATQGEPLRASGLLLDLGFSSEQLEESGRGFSLNRDEPLDMRYNCETRNTKHETGLMAYEIINSFSEKELADIFWKYGEERFSRIIARRIIEERRKKKILTTKELADLIEKVMPRRKGKSWSRIHPATRIFQALRIYVNDELGNLKTLLENVEKIIKPKGRVAIISFHSLEDRLVKNRFRELQKGQKAQILTKKPVRPSQEEILNNPRSRSAKLRACSLI